MRSSEAYGSDPNVFERKKEHHRTYRKKPIEHFALPANVIDSASKLDPTKYYVVGSLNQSVSTTVSAPILNGEACKSQYPSSVFVEYIPTPNDHAICSTGTLDVYNDPGISDVTCTLTDSNKNYYRYFQKKSDSLLDTPSSQGGATLKKSQYGGRTCSQQLAFYPSNLDTRTLGKGPLSLGFCPPVDAVCATGDEGLYTVDKSVPGQKCNLSINDIIIVSAYYGARSGNGSNYSGRYVLPFVLSRWNEFVNNANKNFIFIPNTDYPGGDIAYRDIPFSQCATECKALENCGGYSTNKTKGSGCWLKTRAVYGNVTNANTRYYSGGTSTTNNDTYYYPTPANYNLTILPANLGGDPAPGVPKMLYVNYRIGQDQTVYTATGGDNQTFDFNQLLTQLSIVNQQVCNSCIYAALNDVTIQSAFFGTSNNQGTNITSRAIMQWNLYKQDTISVFPVTVAFIQNDPNPGVAKFVFINYTIGSSSTVYTAVSPEGINFDFSQIVQQVDRVTNGAHYMPLFKVPATVIESSAITKSQALFNGKTCSQQLSSTSNSFPDWKLVGKGTTSPSYCPPQNASCLTYTSMLYVNPSQSFNLNDVTIQRAVYGSANSAIDVTDYVRNTWNTFKYCQQQLLTGLAWKQVPVGGKFIPWASFSYWPDNAVSIFNNVMTVLDNTQGIWYTLDYTAPNPVWVLRDGKAYNVELSNERLVWVRGLDLRPYRSNDLTVSGNWYVPNNCCSNAFQVIAKEDIHYELSNNRNGNGSSTMWYVNNAGNWSYFRDGNHFPYQPYQCLSIDRNPGSWERGAYTDGRNNLIFITHFWNAQWVDRAIKGFFSRVCMYNYACAMIGIDRNVYYTPDIRSDEKAFLIAYGPAACVSLCENSSGNRVVTYIKNNNQIFYTVIPSLFGNQPAYYADPDPGSTSEQLTVTYTIGKSSKLFSFTAPDYNNIDTMFWHIPLVVQTRATTGAYTYTINDVTIQSAFYYPVNNEGRNVTSLLQSYWNVFKSNQNSSFPINNTTMGADPLPGFQKRLYVNFKIADYPVTFIDSTTTENQNYTFWYIMTALSYLNNSIPSLQPSMMCTKSPSSSLFYRPWYSIPAQVQNSAPITTSFPANGGRSCSALNPLGETSLLDTGTSSPTYCPPQNAKCADVITSNVDSNYSYPSTPVTGSSVIQSTFTPRISSTSSTFRI